MTGADFKAARESLGLTQAQLAKLLGYGSQSRIAEIEGRGAAPGPAVAALSAYVGGWRPAEWPLDPPT